MRTFNGLTLDQMARRAARQALHDFIAERGYSWNETHRPEGDRVLDHMPITEIHDLLRDAAYDVIVDAGLDPDEFLLDVTDLALNEVGV